MSLADCITLEDNDYWGACLRIILRSTIQCNVHLVIPINVHTYHVITSDNQITAFSYKQTIMAQKVTMYFTCILQVNYMYNITALLKIASL